MTTQELGYNRNTLLEMLRNRIVEVTFHKQNGTTRLLRATLRSDLIPTPKKKKAASNAKLITAWDLDAEGWRSFHPETVLKVN